MYQKIGKVGKMILFLCKINHIFIKNCNRFILFFAVGLKKITFTITALPHLVILPLLLTEIILCFIFKKRNQLRGYIEALF
jgi:hypothetical protein